MGAVCGVVVLARVERRFAHLTLVSAPGELVVVAPLSKMALLATLRALADMRDVESAHLDADTALLAYVFDPEITAAFKAVTRWYS